MKGDLLIRDFWTQGTDSINITSVVNTDAVSQKYKTPKKCLDISEREKNKNYLHACLNKRQNFIPFVSSMDVLLGVKAAARLKRIASCVATNWKDPYSRT